MDMQNGIVNGIADNAGVIRANQQAIAMREHNIYLLFSLESLLQVII